MTSHLLDNVGTIAAFALQPLLLELLHLIVEAYSLLASSSLCAEGWIQTTDLRNTNGIPTAYLTSFIDSPLLFH